MSDVFISYSRRNATFARRLTEHLARANKDLWVDWEDIPFTAEWWSEIQTGIENADNFLFIVSPESMASIVCNLELSHARKLGKRIIPIIYEDTNPKDAYRSLSTMSIDGAMSRRLDGKNPVAMAQNNWQQMSHINWLFFRESDDFDVAFEALVKTVETDLAYVKAHTRYLTRAQEWSRNNQPVDLLLFGDEIERAEAWLQLSDDYEAKDTDKQQIANPLAQPIQRAYITQSREQDKRRKRLARSAQASIAVLAIVLIGGVIGGYIALTGLNEQINGANMQLAEATEALVAVNTRVASANDLLSAVPPTLTQINSQVIDAQSQADEASTQVASANNQLTAVPPTLTEVSGVLATVQLQADMANEQLATATQVLVTATYVAELEAEAQVTLGAVSTEISFAVATVTQSAVDSDILDRFSQMLLRVDFSDEQRLAVVEELVADYPDAALAYAYRGQIYSQVADFDKAIADYTRALDLDPTLERVYSSRGYLYSLQGDHLSALDDYNSAIELGETNAITYSNRALTHLNLGDIDLAIADLDMAIEIDPTESASYLNRGLAYVQMGNYERGIADFTVAIELEPDLPLGYLNRGRAYIDLGEIELARADFTSAIEIDPNNASAYRSRGNTYRDVGLYEEAITDYTVAIGLEPNNASAYYNRGAAYLFLGNYDSALADFEQLVAINPTDGNVYYNRGLVYFLLSDSTVGRNLLLALDDMNTAIELNSGIAYLLRARIYYILGDYPAALADFDQYEASGGTIPDDVLPQRDEAERIVNEGE